MVSNISQLSSTKNEIFEIVLNCDENAFLLIDSTLERYNKESAFYEFLQDYKRYPLVFPHEDLNGALLLHLIPLNKNIQKDMELFNASVEEAFNEIKSQQANFSIGRSVCAWISSQLSVERLANYIANSVIQEIPSIGSVLIRFYDPSVLTSFLDIVDNWQQQRLLSNMKAWCYIDGNGDFHSVNGDGQTQKLSYSLGLSKENFADLENVTLINKILRIYRESEWDNKLSEISAIERLRPALRFFSSRFPHDEYNVIEFGIDVLTSQPSFI